MNNLILCLHFDINKTILMNDQCTTSEMINSLLSECTWGISSNNISTTNSSSNNNDKTSRNIDYTCYDNKEDKTILDWRICHPKPSINPPTIENAITFGNYIETYTNWNKKEIKQMKRSFTSTNCIGESIRSYYDEIHKALSLDTNIINIAKNNNLSYLTDGYYQIIPSFFKLIEYLIEMKINFRIIFRTFGTDLNMIIEEYNLFCSGKHPAYQSKYILDGTDPRIPNDYRLKAPYFEGKLRRTNHSSDGIELQHIDVNQNTIITTVGSKDIYNLLIYEWFKISTTQNNIETITENDSKLNNDDSPKTFIAAIQDDYQWWHANQESDESGKVLLIDNHNPQLIQVFFDDNIERDRPHIVDVRNYSSFLPVSFEDTRYKILKRVEPYAAILDQNYYIKHIEDVLEDYVNANK